MKKSILFAVLFVFVLASVAAVLESGWTRTTNPATARTALGVPGLTNNNVFTGNSTNTFNTVIGTNIWDKSNVKFWGAKVDGGVTDDTVAISAALASGQKSIVIPDGGTLMTSNLYLYPNQTLTIGQGTLNIGTNNRIVLNTGSRIIGSGVSNTVISVYNTNGAAIASTSSVANVELKDFTLYGNGLGSTGIVMNAWVGSRIQTVTIDRFRNATDTGVGLLMTASSLGGCYDNNILKLTIDNCDTALLMDSSDDANICGYNNFYGLKIGQEINCIWLLKSTANGSGYNTFYGTFIQGTSTTNTAVAVKVEGINNIFYGLKFDQVSTTNLWFAKTTAAGNYFKTTGLNAALLRDDNTVGPVNCIDDGTGLLYSPNRPFYFNGVGGNVAFDAAPSTDGFEMIYSNPLLNAAWKWRMASNASPNLVLSSASGTVMTFGQDKSASLASYLLLGGDLTFLNLGSGVSWSGGPTLSAPSANVVKIVGDSAFSLLQLGGSTASFPALKRANSTVEFRLADDSGSASVLASNVTAVRFSGSGSNLTDIATGGSTSTFGGHFASGGAVTNLATVLVLTNTSLTYTNTGTGASIVSTNGSTVWSNATGIVTITNGNLQSVSLNTTGTGSNTMDNLTVTNNVGIGVVVPTSDAGLTSDKLLHIQGLSPSLRLDSTDSGGIAYQLVSSVGGGLGYLGIFDGTSNVFRQIIDKSGNVTIGPTASSAASFNVLRDASIRTNVAQFDVTKTDFVIGTRYTNSNRRAFVAASFQLAAAVAGTAAVTMNVEQSGTTNKLTVSSGPLTGLTTIEPLTLLVGPGAFYYFTDTSSGDGAVASIVAGTSSQTGL